MESIVNLAVNDFMVNKVSNQQKNYDGAIFFWFYEEEIEMSKIINDSDSGHFTITRFHFLKALKFETNSSLRK